MAKTITPFLMFEGDAEAAITLYTTVFRDTAIVQIERYAAGEPGREGSIKRARFTLCGQDIQCTDSPVHHAFTFTPSISLFVDCDDEAELQRVFGELADGGKVLMPLNDYGFSRKFGWVSDRFGVSWQLNLPA